MYFAEVFMEKTGNRGGLKLVLGIIILVAAIVGLVIALSSCGGDDGDLAENPPVVDKADGGEAVEPDSDADASSGGAASSGAVSGGSQSGSEPSNTAGSGASLEEWIEYLKNYDDNVENGVESATDAFTDMIDQVGDQMSNGNYGEGFDQFGTGLKDYLGGLAGSLRP